MIHIVNMPFASLMHPSMAAGQIKSILLREGMDCRVHNFNFLFAGMIGLANYELMALQRGFDVQVGEWLFSRQAWNRDFGPSEDQCIEECLQSPVGMYQKDDARAWFRRVRNHVVPEFLDRAAREIVSSLPESVDSGHYPVVGFSCTYFQTLSSIALMRRLRQLRPDVKIVCGGACFHDEMGLELIRVVDCIDAISMGEADDVVAPLFRALSTGQEPRGLQGVVFRSSAGQLVQGPPPAPVAREILENNPDPDFQEYVQDLAALHRDSRGSARIRVFLPFEASRGCWKGQRMHCTFCGLNNRGLAFRAKSGARVRKTLDHLAGTYPGINRYHATDCILPREFFNDFLPDLCDNPIQGGAELFAEVRSTLNRQEMELLARAGVVYLQPGVESLSTHLLQCMNKGVTALRNVYFLKLCRVNGIYPLWNIMTRVPGEVQQDYDAMSELIPRLIHLPPPFGGARFVEMQRFSPYFTNPGRWASEIKPRPWYRALYPQDSVQIENVAYFFDARWKDVLEEKAYDRLHSVTEAWINIWRFSSDLPRLDYVMTDNKEMIITDTRKPSRNGRWELDFRESSVMRLLDDPITKKGIMRELPELELTEEELDTMLGEFMNQNLVIQESGQYLNLLLPQGVSDPGFSFRRSEARLDLNTRFTLI